MLKGIIFDLDGTIGNTLPLCVAAFKQAIEPLAGRELSAQEIIETFGPSEEGTIRALIPTHYDEALTRYLALYRTLHSMCPEPFDGIMEVLNYAKQHHLRLALVTGKGAQSAVVTLEIFKIASCFDAIETGSPHGPNKVEGIRRVLEILGITPDESVYVGDMPSDIEASRQVGIPIISAGWAGTTDVEALRRANPDHLFTTVQEFQRYVEQRVG